jgi:hypothetical protein
VPNLIKEQTPTPKRKGMKKNSASMSNQETTCKNANTLIGATKETIREKEF